MKKTIVILFILISGLAQAQYDVYKGEVVYAEFWNAETNIAFISDWFETTGYSNAYDPAMHIADTINSENAADAGLFMKLAFCLEGSSDDCYQKIMYLKEQLKVGTEGIYMQRMWDNKLYAYCKVTDLHLEKTKVTVTLFAVPNVGQRKKLLFRDSSRLRMWNHPWVGK